MLTRCGHLVVVSIVCCSASAEVSTFNNRNLWTIATKVNAITTEGFEGATTGPLGPGQFGTGLGISSTSSFAAIESSWPYNWGMHNTTANGANYLHVGDGTNSTTGPAFTLTLNLPTLSTAIGFDISGFQHPPLLATIMRGGQVVGSFTLAEGVVFNPAFAGVVSSESFDRLTLTTQPGFGGDDFALDEISWAIPAPGAIGMLGMLGCLRTRRR